MPTRSSWRLERQFGRSVGLVLAAVGGWLLFRRGGLVGLSLATVGGTLLLLAAVRPQWLTTPRRWWMALAEGLSFVSTRIILAIVFFGVVTPIGVVRRLRGADPLERRTGGAPRWTPYPPRQHDPKHYEKMY